MPAHLAVLGAAAGVVGTGFSARTMINSDKALEEEKKQTAAAQNGNPAGIGDTPTPSKDPSLLQSLKDRLPGGGA